MRAPTEDEVAEIAADLGITFGVGESEKVAELVAESIALLEDVEEMPTPRLGPREYTYTDRGPGYQPDEEEDPHNAWITKCEIEGASDGPLAHMTIGLKDNISLAGIEMTNGSDVMQGYVPAADATVVTRLLDAGATILGKNNMWSFSLGPSDYGPAKNPAASERSIGGSSSGTAAAVATGDVDIGMGGDQAGSVRIPASFGGLVGMKPTHGLVPYTGIFGADPTQDHTGPLTRTVEEAALATEVLAGRDGFDPRQPHDLSVDAYTKALSEDISDVTIGVLTEGFEHEESDPEVNEVAREAIADLEELGADVTEISVPTHLHSRSIHTALGGYGVGQVLQQNGIGVGFQAGTTRTPWSSSGAPSTRTSATSRTLFSSPC
ncbi:amidase family protein [Halarchaeum acidiphilum]|uniref:amidase family protein n=1 Tax=Halarchaeum acidiphilum TaxID=489138 RepID=UPI000677C4EB|nr:amidase family protein [Halarchaeum acidiphilum]